jgi:phosphoribosyl 1,2-cyclic phosphodiesterase
MTRFASLGSGSQGNALVFESGTTRLLLDCGFNLREVRARLGRLGLVPEDLAGIIVTHEHSDHSGGVFALARQYRLPVWLTYGTYCAVRESEQKAVEGVDVTLIDGLEAISIGDALVQPYTVPHDAREPVQYVLSDGVRRLGVLTDAGCSTPHIEAMLSGCDALVLEANHDRDLLMKGAYPSWLKARVGGRFGHLNNNAAAALLSTLDCSRLKHLVAAHLSQQNNTPELARKALVSALGCAPDWIALADQTHGFDWKDLS